jgi:hypothetical protein
MMPVRSTKSRIATYLPWIVTLPLVISFNSLNCHPCIGYIP